MLGTLLLRQDDCEDVAVLEVQHQVDHEDVDALVVLRCECSQPLLQP